MTVDLVVDVEVTARNRTIITFCENLLASIRTQYDQRGLSLPSRQYWTLGTPVDDCEQLVVHVVQGYIGLPGDQAAEPQRCNAPRTISVNVRVVRCIPTMSNKGTPPTPAMIMAGSEALAMDMYTLLDLSADLDQWDPLGGPGLGVIATVESGEPEGGYQSVILALTMGMP